MPGNRSAAFPCAQPVDDQKSDPTLCSHSWQELLWVHIEMDVLHKMLIISTEVTAQKQIKESHHARIVQYAGIFWVAKAHMGHLIGVFIITLECFSFAWREIWRWSRKWCYFQLFCKYGLFASQRANLASFEERGPDYVLIHFITCF